MDLQRTVVLVPMKRLSACKSRLSLRLSPSQRRTLSLNMLKRVLQALQSANVRTWVVGGDDPIAHLAHDHGACWLNDEGHDLNDSLSTAFDRAFERADAAIYLPGDLPFISADDVQRLASVSDRSTRVVMAPERRGDGTNALLMTAQTRLSLTLGPGSFQRHRACAESCGIPFEVYDSPGIGYDLDTVADLEFYESFDADRVRSLLSMNGDD